MTLTSSSDTVTLRADGSYCITQKYRLSLAQLRDEGRSSADVAAESLQERQIGWHPLGRGSPAAQDECADLPRVLCDFLKEARLANPWFARQECDVEATGSGRLQLAPQRGEFAFAPEKAGLPIGCSLFHHAFP